MRPSPQSATPARHASHRAGENRHARAVPDLSSFASTVRPSRPDRGDLNLIARAATITMQACALPVAAAGAGEDRPPAGAVGQRAQEALQQFDSRSAWCAGRWVRRANGDVVPGRRSGAAGALWHRRRSTMLKAANAFDDHVTRAPRAHQPPAARAQSDCSEYRKAAAAPPTTNARCCGLATRIVHRRGAALTWPAAWRGSAAARRSALVDVGQRGVGLRLLEALQGRRLPAPRQFLQRVDVRLRWWNRPPAPASCVPETSVLADRVAAHRRPRARALQEIMTGNRPRPRRPRGLHAVDQPALAVGALVPGVHAVRHGVALRTTKTGAFDAHLNTAGRSRRPRPR